LSDDQRLRAAAASLLDGLVSRLDAADLEAMRSELVGRGVVLTSDSAVYLAHRYIRLDDRSSTLASPVQLTPGSCGCSTSGRTCACMPADFDAKSFELTLAKLKADEARDRRDADEEARWRGEQRRLVAELRTVMEFRMDENARFDRDEAINRICDLTQQYRGRAEADTLRGELVAEDDAYVEARCDSIERVALPRWRRDSLARELVAAGEREVAQHKWHNQARADAAPRISWPDGFDRKKAVDALREAGMYDRELGADDLWIFGALKRLLVIGWPKGVSLEQMIAQLKAAGVTLTAYGHPLEQAPGDHVLAAWNSLRMRQMLHAKYQQPAAGVLTRADAIEPTERDRRQARHQAQAFSGAANFESIVESEARGIARRRAARGRSQK